MSSVTTTWGFLASALAASYVLWQRKQLRGKVVVVDGSALDGTLRGLEAGGVASLCVVMDFDRTITTYYGPNRSGKGKSCHGILEAIRSPAVKAKADALNAKYYPIETNPGLSMADKIPAMEEWYSKINALLIEDGLRAEDVQAAVARSGVMLRPGVAEIIDFCGAHHVPLLVFSAGIGDVLQEVLLQRYGLLPPEVVIVSNWMSFDASGLLTSWSTPTLHMFNKNEARLLDSPEFAPILSRPNVLLCGDSLGDASMVDGGPTPHRHVLKFGLLNDGIEALLPQYEALYDVVLLDDAPLYAAVAVLHRVAEAEESSARRNEDSADRSSSSSSASAGAATWMHTAAQRVPQGGKPAERTLPRTTSFAARVPTFA